MAYSSHGDDEGRVVGTLYNVVVKLNDLLDARYYRGRQL